MIDIQNLKPAVRIICKKFRTSKYITQEDMEQEAWLKLIEVLPHLTEVNKNELKLIPLAKEIVKNLIIDKIRYEKVRGEFNSSYLSIDLEEAIAVTASNINQHEFLIRHEMMNAFNEWVEMQTPRVKKLFTEAFIEPSEDTLKKWELLKKKNPMYRQYNNIPVSTIAKFMGIPTVVATKCMKDLRFHMRCYGHA